MTAKRAVRRPPPARQAALGMVARRLVSESEVRQRLERKGYVDDDVEDAVELVKSYGYLDDVNLARAIRQEAERTGRGPLWVSRTLSRRGIVEDVRRATEEAAGAAAIDRARAVVVRRFGEPTDLVEGDRRRAFRLLLGRGFSPETATEVLDTI